LTISGLLAAGVRRIAEMRHVTVGRALVEFAMKLIEAEAEAEDALTSSYRRFMAANDVATKDAGGKDLVRSIFGRDSIADDPIC
jgi:hypothetical protein